jgi:hypothetical protein
MTSQSQQPVGRLLFCHRCNDERARAEFRLLLRRVPEATRSRRLMSVLRHTPCNTVVFVMLD